MIPILKRLFTNTTGATAVEYGFLAVFIAIAIIVSLTAMGHSVSDIMGTVDEGMGQNEPQSVG